MDVIDDDFEPKMTYAQARNGGDIDLFTATLPVITKGIVNANDEKLGTVKKIVEQIKKSRPKAFLLESSEKISQHQFGDYLGNIMADLQCSANYVVEHRVIDSAAHGIPHCRKRLYVWYKEALRQGTDGVARSTSAVSD